MEVMDLEVDDSDVVYFDEELTGFDDEMESLNVNECISSTIDDAMNNMVYAMIIVNIIAKLLLKIDLLRGEKLGNSLLIFAGLSLIFYHFRSDLFLSVYFLFFAITGLILTNFSPSNRPIWGFALVIISINEFIIRFITTDFIKLRIFFMSTTMKLISLHSEIKDLRSHKKKDASRFIPRMIAYLFHPSGLPFCGYSAPCLSKSPQEWSKSTGFFKSIKSLFAALLFLSFSDCVLIFLGNFCINFSYFFMVQVFPAEFVRIVEKFLIIYFKALQFRTSHYFVSFLIQSSHFFWGNEITVAKPLKIELPRSLVNVVIAWDIPMHQWLKENVYIPAKSKWGFAASVLITYLTSSYIHGFRFEIWSVLLSLGLFTWIETKFRSHLASTFNACIGAKSCTYESIPSPASVVLNFLRVKFGYYPSLSLNCMHGHKHSPFNSFLVVTINLAFSVLAIVHLAYLGSSFDLSEEASSTKYVIDTWQDIGFYSHIIGLISLVVYFIIK